MQVQHCLRVSHLPLAGRFPQGHTHCPWSGPSWGRGSMAFPMQGKVLEQRCWDAGRRAGGVRKRG